MLVVCMFVLAVVFLFVVMVVFLFVFCDDQFCDVALCCATFRSCYVVLLLLCYAMLLYTSAVMQFTANPPP